MKINGPLSPDVLAAQTKTVREAAAAEAISSSNATKPETPAPAKRRDSVEISDAGRQLSGSLSADRVADVRQRILSGAYNATEVIDTVARRILQRGDI